MEIALTFTNSYIAICEKKNENKNIFPDVSNLCKIKYKVNYFLETYQNTWHNNDFPKIITMLYIIKKIEMSFV
jgi:hypothetical protein